MSSLAYMIIPHHFYFYLIRQYGTKKLEMCYSKFVSVIIKISSIPVTRPFRSLNLNFFGRELMLSLPIITLFVFPVLVFLITEKQSVALREFLHAPKRIFLGTLLSRFLSTSIYVSTNKDLALLVFCQSKISFTEL